MKTAKFTSVGARKEIPVSKKSSNTLTKTTLLTPTGIKKIQAIPIEVKKSPPAKPTKKVTSTSAKNSRNQSSKKGKSIQKTSVTSTKRTARAATKPVFYDDSSDDSDEPLKNLAKKPPSSSKKKVTPTKKSPKYKKTKQVTKKQVAKTKKSTAKSKPKPAKISTYAKQKKMIQKRNQRIRLDYGYMSSKAVHNGRSGKKYMTKKFLQVKKQKKTIDDYQPLIRKYRYLIPDDSYVRIERLKFCASHFTKERFRLPSDIDLFRDGASFYGLLGKIFDHMDLIGKINALGVCRLWNRASNEDAAWQTINLRNVNIHDLRPLERLILKRETTKILMDNVDVLGKAVDYELCRLSCVKELVVRENASPILLGKFLISCNNLENVVIPDTKLDYLCHLNIYVKSLNAENAIVSESENRLLKTWSDLETLAVHSFDPRSYYNMGLLLSLKSLKLKQLCITYNIAQFIENIPNIEYIEFTPEYFDISYAEGNKAIVESLKHCPSLRKLTWIIVKKVELKHEKVEEEKPVKIEIKQDEKMEDEEENAAKVTETPEKMDVDMQPPPENTLQPENVQEESFTQPEITQMETDTLPQDIIQTQDPPQTLGENQIQTENNTDLFDCLKEPTQESTEPPPTVTDEGNNETIDESKVTSMEKEEVKEEPEEDEDVESVKNESECEQKSHKDYYQPDSLQLLTFKVYCKSSLPDCEVTFKVVKIYEYID